ncbi:MAG TPA: 8-amino-7-oxononanoate synthase [Gammaproteobacteria bacterium]
MSVLPTAFQKVLDEQYRKRASQNLVRERRPREEGTLPLAKVNGRTLINFCGNDYLGLSAHETVINAAKTALDTFGFGSGASQLVSGYTTLHRQLEETLAAKTGRDRALVFSTGYMANQAIINSLMGRGDLVVGDRFNHASMIDAAMISRARFKRYPHCDTSMLTTLLNQHNKGKKMIVTDTVFSMDGDIAPLAELSAIGKQQEAILVVDDAHGFGVLGKSGGGTLEEQDLGQVDVPLMMATFGKALGGFGAFVAGDDDLIEALMQTSRTLIYTTAPPPAIAAAALAALELLETESWRRTKLRELITQFIHGAGERGIPLSKSVTAIQPIILGSADASMNASQYLFEQGFWVAPIRPPTVPPGTSRLRVTLSAGHEPAQVDALLESLAAALEQRR